MQQSKLKVCATMVLVLFSSWLSAGEPGRLEDDTEFLLGNWSNDCKAGSVKIFLKDGALRQQGLVQLLAQGSKTPISPITLLAATRDAGNIVLEAKTKRTGLLASSRYSGVVVNDGQLKLKNMTLCQAERCRSAAVDIPWQRCS
jgi:hypothetical protein